MCPTITVRAIVWFNGWGGGGLRLILVAKYLRIYCTYIYWSLNKGVKWLQVLQSIDFRQRQDRRVLILLCLILIPRSHSNTTHIVRSNLSGFHMFWLKGEARVTF